MVLVIFGAGASYDSVPGRSPSESTGFGRHGLPCRPPLANELFADSPEFVTPILSFPRLHPLIPRLRNIPQGSTIEAELDRLQAEGADDPERIRQVAAVRCYLHYLIWDFTQQWEAKVAHSATNYKTLMDDIRRWLRHGHRACLVTFNYDTMLESALPIVGLKMNRLGQSSPNGINEFIAQDHVKVVKVHGSINWGREVETPIADIAQLSTWETMNRLVELAPELRVSSRYQIMANWPIGREGNSAFVPAVAIPLQSKKDFECPGDHLQALQQCLPDVTKLLVIGWRGMDEHFLKLLAGGLHRRVKAMVVAGGEQGAAEIAHRLAQGGVQADFVMSNGGFTQFVTRRESEGFLKG